MKYIYSLLILFSCFVSNAQLQDSTVQFNGEKYLLHRMEQGETLYQLSRKYKVAFSSIKEANPEKRDDIPLGDFVRIPSTAIAPQEVGIKTIDESVSEDSDVQGEIETPLLPGYFWHEVEQGETVYSLTKRFKTRKIQFFKDNSIVGLVGLKTGQKVKFFKQEADTTRKDELVKIVADINSSLDSVALSDTNVARIGILLPFNLNQNRERMDNVKPGKEVEVLNQTNFFLEFLQGAKYAFDSLRRKGMNIQVFVYDTRADSNHIETLLNKPEFKKLDIVFGPAYGHNFEYLAKKINGRSTFLVSPYGKNMSILANNPKVIKCRSSVQSRVTPLAKFLYDNHKSDNLILSHENNIDLPLIEKLQAEILGLSLINDSVVITAPVIVKGVFEPVEQLSSQKKNIVVSMNSKESFATKLVVKMQNKHKEFDIVLVGMEEWKSYNNIEVRYWQSLNMHVVGNLDFKYLGVKSDDFFKSYYSEYYTEPSYHAVLANELVINLLGNMKSNKYNHSQVAGKFIDGEISDYLFKFTGNQTGIDNKSATVYKYEEFKFVPCND